MKSYCSEVQQQLKELKYGYLVGQGQEGGTGQGFRDYVEHWAAIITENL